MCFAGRCFAGLVLLVTVAVAALLAPSPAWAHGGTPYSLRVMRVPGQKTLYMPTYWWGLWVGSTDAATDPTSPWHFVCEEAINPYQNRRFSISVDGALYATNQAGVTVARQNACEWVSTTAATGGELASLASSDVATHPTDGATAWAATGTNSTVDDKGVRKPAPNGIFRTHDHGDTWTRVSNLGAVADPTFGRTFDSIEISAADPQTMYVTSTDWNAPFGVVVHQSTDGGTTFSTSPTISIAGRGAIFSLQIMAVDPRDPQVFYARATLSGATPTQIFVRGLYAGATITLTELWSISIPQAIQTDWSKGINDLAFDLAHDQLIVATGKGLVRGSAALTSAASTFAASDNLAQAQCVDYDPASGRLFACGGTFGPDFAALASNSATSATLKSVFAFTDTLGPIDCPADTTVAKKCPAIWSTYQYELNPGGDVTDGGTSPVDASTPITNESGCSMSGAHQQAPWGLLMPLFAIWAWLLDLAFRAPVAATPRRRETPRP